MTTMTDVVLSRTKQWLEEIVIGLNLCPFASSVFLAKQVRFRVSDARDADAVVRDALSEAMLLIESPADEIATTLLICPNALNDFDEYLDSLSMIEALLAEAGADGLLQIASFHPRYRFEGEDEAALSHFTNRSPYPVFHFLRESQVQEAVDSHPDTASIPNTNIARLNELGAEDVVKRWKKFLDL